MKRVYLGFKFHEDGGNRRLIESVDAIFKRLGFETIVIVRDLEEFGQKKFAPDILMQKTFEAIDASDFVVIEFSEKGVGLGIEAGYAVAKMKPVWVIAPTNSEISTTLAGIAQKVIFYGEFSDLEYRLEQETL